MKEGKMPTPQPVDMDALLRSAETNDCYDDDVVSILKARELEWIFVFAAKYFLS